MTRRRPEPDRRFASRITPEQAQRIRLDRAAGVSIGELARRLGVARSSVSAVVAGRTHRVADNTEPRP